MNYYVRKDRGIYKPLSQLDIEPEWSLKSIPILISISQYDRPITDYYHSCSHYNYGIHNQLCD